MSKSNSEAACKVSDKNRGRINSKLHKLLAAFSKRTSTGDMITVWSCYQHRIIVGMSRRRSEKR